MELRMWKRGVEDARQLSAEGVEVWTPAPYSPERYFVSNLGRVASLTRDREPSVLKPSSQKYPGVGIYVNPGDKDCVSVTVHKLVLLAFEGEAPKGLERRHLNGVTHDARLCNLTYGTRSENMKDVWAHRGVLKPENPVKAEPKATFSLDAKLVKLGISMFEKGRAHLSDLSEMWGCSRDVARRVLVGETWDHLDRDLKAIEARLGREGEKHHLTSLTREKINEALVLYVKNHWSSVQFGHHLGIDNGTAQQILGKKTWVGKLVYPDGFQYPWPDAATMNARKGEAHHATKLTEAQILAVFDRVIAGEFSSVEEIGEALGLSKSAAFSLVRGRSWPDLPRSDAFKAAIEGMMGRKVLSPEQRELIVRRLVENDTPEVREQIMQDFGIDKVKLQSYVTKANKRRLG